jgi:alpha-ketoglutarate-dependent 2,4-dichlorophenoxyacetate dioxygenase
MVTITPVYEQFVAEVTGVNLATGVGDEEFQQIRQALDRYAVLVLPGQPLNEEQQLAFAGLFGPLETSVGASIYNANSARRLAKPQLSDISNLDDQGGILTKGDVRRLINLSNQLWHTDSSFKRTPASVSMLSAQEVTPVGGATEFADMRAAWDALSESRQRELEPLIAIHDYFHSRMLTGFDSDGIPEEWRLRQPPVPQVLVRKHPATGRKSLYLASHISQIGDMTQEDSMRLLDEIMSFATRAEFVYRHRWRENDVVVWDNRCTCIVDAPLMRLTAAQ